jgi:pentatricopeptide repeat protein
MKEAGVEADRVTYNTLLRANTLGQPGDTRAARALLRHMQVVGGGGGGDHSGQGIGHSGVSPDRTTFLTLMDCYVASGRLEEAKAVMGDMREQGIAPSVSEHNLIIRGIARARHSGPADAKAALDDLVSSGLLDSLRHHQHQHQQQEKHAEEQAAGRQAAQYRVQRDRGGDSDLMHQAQIAVGTAVKG